MYSTKDTPLPVPFVEGASTMAPPSGAGPMQEMQEPSTSGEAHSVQTTQQPPSASTMLVSSFRVNL